MNHATKSAGDGVLRLLPSIDEVLGTAAAERIVSESGQRRLTILAREAVETLRSDLRRGDRQTDSGDRASLLADAELRLEAAWKAEHSGGIRRVINATGVVIHTNLGRAPLSDAARDAIANIASGYCTLEYDAATGKRGRRGRRAESLICELTGAESAVIVNNCAAAAFLVLTVIARGGEVIVSRGELVEIGGDFRIPDVLAQSGAVLREVGTTNRTKVSDYKYAINENTSVILRVHPSNYKIIGFTEMPANSELTELAHQNGLVFYEDAGSGALVGLGSLGLGDEPLIRGSIADGVDIVTFSGDKLLGGPQAGIISGRSDLIEKIHKHPLYRALRVDKLVYAALEATLLSYSRETHFRDLPVLKMLSMPAAELETRTREFGKRLAAKLGDDSDLVFEIAAGNSVVGGGSAPGVHPETTLMLLSREGNSAEEIEQKLRSFDTPVIARIVDDRVAIDLRTVRESEEFQLIESISALAN